jgi:hypothetical protein
MAGAVEGANAALVSPKLELEVEAASSEVLKTKMLELNFTNVATSCK